jgi:hypothetical protein
MRRSAAAAALIGALVLMLGAVVAYADPGFVLTQSEASAGEAVHFTISGTDEDGATYELEIGDKEVAEGSVPADTGVSGAFTMPDLGDMSRTVRVGAHVSQSDETTTLYATLEYARPTQGVTGAAGTEPGLVTPPAHRASPPSTESPTPARKRRPSRRPAGKRRAHRSPISTRERRSGGPRPSIRVHSGDRRSASPPLIAPYAPASSSVDGELPAAGRATKRPSGERGGGPVHSTIPATSSLTPAISGDDRPGIPLAILVVLAFEGLAALALISASLARRWRPAPVQGLQEDADDEILRGAVHVPDSASSSRSKRSR